MARTVITPELIVKINELYLEIGTYAGVSRALGGTPSATTVKKYIISDYKSAAEIETNKKVFTADELPDFTEECVKQFACENWGDLCKLSDAEIEEITELWQEMTI